MEPQCGEIWNFENEIAKKSSFACSNGGKIL